MTTLITTLTEGDWPSFAASYERDRIPFLEALVAHASGRAKLTGLSAVTSDGISGWISVYLARTAEEVVCCVPGVHVATELTAWLAATGATNVSVRMNAPIRPGGPTIFPFITRRFDVALLAVKALHSSTANDAVRDLAKVLKPDGKLVLIVWAPLLNASPLNFEDSAITPSPSSPPTELPNYSKLLHPFEQVIRDAGFRNLQSEQCACRCITPSRAAYLCMERRRLTPRRYRDEIPNTLLEHRLAEAGGPMVLAGWSALVFADAPDPMREMS
jgi:SAM-dependent methyltransferase